MKDFCIGVPLDHNIGHRNLQRASEAGDLASHSSYLPQLDEIGEGSRGRSNQGSIGRRGEVVEPEDAVDAAGAVVEGELEKSVGFEFTGGDGANGFGAREGDASARERERRVRRRRGLGEGKKIEGE